MMRCSVVIVEALKGLLARPYRSLISVLIVAAIMGTCLWIESGQVSEALKRMQEGMSKGSNVLIVSSKAGSIRAADCMKLNAYEGVIAVGSVNTKTVVSSPRAPRAPFQLVSVSPGYMRVSNSKPILVDEDVYLGSALSEELGIVEGNRLDIINRPSLNISAVLSESVRAHEQNRRVFTTEWPKDSVLECWVETTPEVKIAMRQSIAAAFSRDKELEIHIPPGAEAESPLVNWSSRVTTWFWATSACVGAVFLSLTMFTRRNEYALYQVLGWPRGQVALVSVIEHLTIVTLASSVAALTHIAALVNIAEVNGVTVGWSALQLLLVDSVLYSLISPCAFAATHGNMSLLVKNRG